MSQNEIKQAEEEATYILTLANGVSLRLNRKIAELLFNDLATLLNKPISKTHTPPPYEQQALEAYYNSRKQKIDEKVVYIPYPVYVTPYPQVPTYPLPYTC